KLGDKLDPFMEVYYADDIALKTMIRANPGLMLMKDGYVIQKWHYNDIPDYNDIKKKYITK
ncbi:DoxX family protein, partial [Bacteroidota bacterium]